MSNSPCLSSHNAATHYIPPGIEKVTLVLPLLVVSGLLLGTGNVNARTATNSSTAVLEEVVVTARKHEESLQATPIAVSAFTADDLEQRNLTNLMEVSAYAPNVAVSSTARGGGGPSANVYIRGIGQDDFLFTTDPGVGIYIDGVYHPRTIGGVMDLLDLERVEVLRGPQGTLFGKNTIGGAINVVSAKPTGEPGGYVQVTAGNFNRIDARGSFDFSIMEDKLFSKVSFSTKNRDGYGDRFDFNTGNKIDDGLGDEGQTAARGALRWLAADNVTVDFSIDYTRRDQNSAPTVVTLIDTSNAVPSQLWNGFVGGPAGTPYDGRYIIPDNVEDSYGTGPNKVTLDAWGLNGTIEWNMGWATARSITAYRTFDARFGRDGDGSPLPIVATDDSQEQEQISQEIQLFGNAIDDRLRWQTGFFYFDEFGQDRNDVRLTSGLFNALEALPGTLDGSPIASPTAPGGAGNFINTLLDLDFDIFNQIDITSMAAFAQGTFDVSDRLSVTAGLRYTYEEKEYTLEHRRIDSGTFIVPLTTVRNSWNELTPMGSIQFQWTDDLMTYATISEGFKSGGFNGRPIVAALVETFDPESVTSYEIGIKSEWFDRRLRLNAATFYMDYKDLQINDISFSQNTGTLILRTDNIGSAEIQGLELEIQAVPMPGLDIGATLGYLDFDITSLDPTLQVQTVNLNTKNVRTPEWSASTHLQYTWPWRDYGEFSVRGDWAFEDSSFSDIANTPSVIRKAHSIVNARISFEMPKNGWQLTLLGTNLTNKRVINSGSSDLGAFGFTEAIYNRPREWGVTIRKTF